jgi:hypothetical protein
VRSESEKKTMSKFTITLVKSCNTKQATSVGLVAVTAATGTGALPLVASYRVVRTSLVFSVIDMG